MNIGTVPSNRVGMPGIWWVSTRRLGNGTEVARQKTVQLSYLLATLHNSSFFTTSQRELPSRKPIGIPDYVDMSGVHRSNPFRRRSSRGRNSSSIYTRCVSSSVQDSVQQSHQTALYRGHVRLSDCMSLGTYISSGWYQLLYYQLSLVSKILRSN